MRSKEFQIPILIFSLFIYAVSAAEYKSHAKKYSVLEDTKKEIYEQFDEYNIFHDIESIESSGAIVSQESEEQLPESVQEIAGKEILDYLENDKYDNMEYSLEKWQKKNIHSLNEVQNSSFTQVLPPSLKIELPFESNLYLSVRKLIGCDYTSRVYDKEEDGKRKNTSSLKMEQELQMRVLGSVGERINVNVDYDDTVGKNDISMVYKGQSGEFIREVAFGDIKVSLPKTEFTSFSKELFGVKADTRYKNLEVNAFCSQTKGLSETKHFIGNTQREKRTIADTDYVKLKYYSLLRNGDTRTIKNGTIKVYIDYKKLDPKYNFSITSTTTLYDLNSTAEFSYTGNFVELVAGQDYIVDYNTGVLVFKNTLAKEYVVAVNYEFIDGTPLSSLPLIIKDTNNAANITTEIHTFYSLGNLKIIHDNGRGNFILEIKDLNNTIPSTIEGGKNVPSYLSKVGYTADITVDFENGIFRLKESLHDALYSGNDHKYNFETEYQYTVKILMLRPSIVPQSEKIVVDGITLKTGTDYILDYDLGILTIKNENIIKETSALDISYDYSFGSEAKSTLTGVSSRFDLTNNMSFGASMLYNVMSKGTVLPDIRSVPTSLTVGESDFKLTDFDISALNMRVNAEAEYALSSQNINTANKALIDSMDSSAREDLANMLDEAWFHSADKKHPATKRMLSDLSWQSYEMYIRDIDPDLEFVEEQKQLVLELNYDVRYRSQIAFAQKLCPGWEGQNYSKKLYIDVWVKDNNLSSHELCIDYASCINEDSDGCGVLDAEENDHTGVLPWKNIGRKFHNVDQTESLIGAHNGKFNTEDLSGNGKLDKLEDVAGSYSISSSSATVIKTNANGWKQIRIPLGITDASRESWKNIRILRIRLVQVGSGDQGKILIGKIAIVGNKWEKTGLNFADFDISSIGRFDSQYKSLLTNQYYLELCGIKSSAKKDEQALKIKYNTTSPNELVLAKSVYSGESLNISKYESIRFMVYAKPEHGYAAVGDVIIFRACGNDTNYFECRVPVTNDLSWQDWKLITINQNGHGHWSSPDPSAEIVVEGNPSLDRISQFVVGVKSSDSGKDHQVWFNEIHVVGTKKVNGSAWKVGGNMQWNGTDSIGAVIIGALKKSVDRNFQTIAAGVYNRDYSEDNAYFNFEGLKTHNIKVLPVKTGLSKVETKTPSVSENKSNLVSLNDEGRVVTYTGYAETDVNLGLDLPQLSAKYTRSIIDTSKTKRLEDREMLSGTMIYNNPLEFLLLPINVTADAGTTDSYYKIYPSIPIAETKSFLGLDKIKDYLDIQQYHTLEQSKLFSLKLPFKFSRGVLFSPAYAINTVREKNNDFSQEIEYDKTLNQTIGASLILGLINWFSPSFTYSINTKENYDINFSTNAATLLIPGQKKYIERNVGAEISWKLNVCDITSLSLLQSLIFSTYYRLQDSDSYDKVNKKFKSTGFAVDKLWVRNNLLMDLEPFYSSNSCSVKTILNKDDISFSGRYMPFEAFSFNGRLSPLNTVSVNCTYTEGHENSYITGTSKDIYTKIWPDMLVGMSGIEKFFGQIKWMRDTQLNLKLKYNNKRITTYDISYADNIMYGLGYKFQFIKKFDLCFEFEKTDSKDSDYKATTLSRGLAQKYIYQGAFDLGKWRFSLQYEKEDRNQKNASGKYVYNIKKDTYSGEISSDMTFLSGIKIPVLNKGLPLKNRIIFMLNLKYIDQKSEQNVKTDDNINYVAAANTDYEISKYLRLLVGIKFDRFEYRLNSDSNYYDISFVCKLTIQLW